MSKAEDLFGEEHVRRYQETDGEVGHIWRRGSKILVTTTKGRTSGEPRTAPLIYEDADAVATSLVASKGGAPEHPGWYREPCQGAAGRAAGERRGLPRPCPDSER